MFTNFKSFIDTQVSGKESLNFLVKQPPTQTLQATQWRDNHFFGTFTNGSNSVFEPLSGDINRDCHLSEATIINGSADTIVTHYILDILGYYKGIDSDLSGMQTMASSPLPRDYSGVQAYLVTTSNISAQCQAVIGYTNSNGVSGRTSSIFLFTGNTGQVQSNLLTGSFAKGTCFIPLLGNDTGIKSIDFVIMATRSPGQFAIVLAKPLQTISTSTANINSELVYMVNRSSLPFIKQNANIGLVSYMNNTPAHAPIIMTYKTIWG